VVLGDRSEAITAAASELHVETIDTQLGEVINGNKIAAVPLNGPSFTDLLALSPAWLRYHHHQRFGPGGWRRRAVAFWKPESGHRLDNGQRRYANGSTVNDTEVVERFTMGAAVVPNLDSIA
jgi:hypothetical protein